MYEIILGRNETDLKKLGSEATIPIGKHYVQMERMKSLANAVYLDVNRPHAILVCGKRGSGKSYTLGVMAEGLANLKSELRTNVATVIFDTMGIYWTMKYPNYKDDKVLSEWKLDPKALAPRIFIPKGLYENFEEKGIPVDNKFAIGFTSMTGEEWCALFDIDINSNEGILIERIILNITQKQITLDKIIDLIKKDDRSSEQEKNLVIARFESVDKWAIFSEKGTNFDTFIKGGETVILDLSAYNLVENGQRIKELVISFIAKKVLQQRLIDRKAEEVKEIKGMSIGKGITKAPLIWMLIDEAHEFLPKEGSTLCSDPLIQILREGRQPGISLVLATQQPGKIHTDVMTQSDIVISHRLTSKIDINALNEIMQTYLPFEVQKYLDNLPRVKGASIVLDDNSEKMYPIQIQPRISWHGGEDPSIIRKKINTSLFSDK
jgi:uncharacterized protein